MFAFLKKKEAKAGGVRELLIVSVPIMISQGAYSLMLFTDRFLLAPLGKEYPACSMLGGFVSTLWVILFMGILNYCNPLIAQYIGAGKKNMQV